jgi:hypothetical protein
MLLNPIILGKLIVLGILAKTKDPNKAGKSNKTVIKEKIVIDFVYSYTQKLKDT